MPSHLEIIRTEWAERSNELAHWAFERMVNRTDVWGSYISKARRRGKVKGRENIFYTAPFPAARGKTFLTPALLRKHFIGLDEGDLLSLHSTSADKTSRWLAIDIDRHHDDDPIPPETNFAAALSWYNKYLSLGFDPLLFDSNGAGGFHVWIFFSEPVPTADVFAFGQFITDDFERLGLARRPETYPKQICIEEGHYGNCIRVPGRHHTREFITRVYSGEPEIMEWLEGSAAVSRMLETSPAPPSKIPRDIPEPEKKPKKPPLTARRQRVCVDLDGVLATYDGWKGLDFMGLPLPGAVEFTKRLAEFADIVIFTTRCCVEMHREELNEPSRPASDLAPRLQHAVRYWLEKHRFVFHEVYIGQGKPAASAYIDDRAVSCSPQENADSFARALAQARALCTGKSKPAPAAAPPPQDSQLKEVMEAWPKLNDTQKSGVLKLLKPGTATSKKARKK